MSKPWITAFSKGPELQRQIHQAREDGNEKNFDVWWLGQSGFLIQWNRKCLLFDPYLSDSLTRKYQGTAKPHVRMGELVIEPQLLDCIDVVSSSHNHTDHLDAETLMPLLKVNPEISFIIPEANRDFVVGRVQCDRLFPLGLNDGEQCTAAGFTFHGVPSAHNEIERDEHGRCRFMGYVVKFGGWTVYHSGDTLLYERMAELLEPFHIDVAFLPINGNDPARGVAGNLNCAEAAQLGKQIGAGVVIPHHYHLFEFNTADPNDFEAEARRVGQAFVILKPGQRWTATRSGQ